MLNPIDLIMSLLAAIGSIPAVGPVLAKAIAVAAIILPAATAIVAVWHSLIGLVVSLSKVPGLSSLQGVADKLNVWDQEAEGVLNQYVLPLLNRLSALPVPEKK